MSFIFQLDLGLCINDVRSFAGDVAWLLLEQSSPVRTRERCLEKLAKLDGVRLVFGFHCP